MATVRPFRGLRPAREYVSRVASPPYDVIDSDEARQYAGGNPYSFLHVVKPEIDLDPEIDLYDDIVYARGKENLERFVAEGVLVQDEEPYFYIYELRMGDHLQTGLVACTSAEEYRQGIIKKHEFTRAEKEADRTRHVDTLNANTGPVLLTYRSDPRIDVMVERAKAEEPVFTFESDNDIGHRFWVLRDTAVNSSIRERFANIDSLYIADGHHRSASGQRVMELRKGQNSDHSGDEEYNFFLSVLFPHDQLKILAYNRVVTDLHGLEVDGFLSRIEEEFDLSETAEPSPPAAKQMSMFLEGKWYRLKAKEGTYPPDDPVESLDVSILMNNLLTPVLGIGDPRIDRRINFVGGIRGTGELERLVESGRYRVAFAMHPTSVNQLLTIADAGKVMPPKSTWFEPKLKSGLVIHRLS